MNPRTVVSWLPSSQQEAIKDIARNLRYRAIRLALSYSAADLETSLRRVGAADGASIMMHSAFSALNGFDGEVQHVIDCILDIIGPNGHLFMVSLPYAGSALDYVAQGDPFDVRRTPSQMGIMSEAFRRRRGVVRSANPLHPVLAWGPRAAWVVAEHESLPHSCGKDSPFEKMLMLDARALMFDVGLEVLTFTHYLEDLFQSSAPVPVYAANPVAAEIIDRDGRRRQVDVYPFSAEARAARNFAVLYDAMQQRGLVARERIGNTVLQMLSLRSLVSVATDLIDHGIHIYGRPGEPVRVPPTRPGRWGHLRTLVREELASGRALRDGRRLTRRLASPMVAAIQASRLPARARREVVRDHLSGLREDPGIDRALESAVAWLCEAQDCSASQDGGVARDYSLVRGWAPSYPATTGCIVPTLLDYAARTNDERLVERARRMLDWLVSIQFADGGFQGGVVGAQPIAPVTFNTGLVLLGLAAGAATFRDPRYVRAMHRAARWLADTQDADGCWRNYVSPFAPPGEKTYDTQVAWGLLEAARLTSNDAYQKAAIRSVQWAVTHQRANGWFGRGCIDVPTHPLTHAVGSVFRGVVEAHRFTRDEHFLDAATLTADALARSVGLDGHLAGRVRSDWSPAVPWVCLTGSAQIAHGLFMLHDTTQRAPYLAAALRLARFVRCTVAVDGSPAMRGGVKGSFPVDGGYCELAYPSWAAKFAIDANLAARDRTNDTRELRQA